ncbi:MAG: TetR/AcrR family transcriptional regulator [Rhodobacter sp.]|nr:TetR/AcrR family transcriptional regulator [Rhodobacter sp.]
MPRPRTFDAEEALSEAMRVFWRKGFAETSYDDLVAATGVSRKGLYTVFGDKQELFLKSLDHYERTVVPSLFGALKEDDLNRAKIITMFEDFAKLAASGEGSIGCFMANTAADVTISIPEVRDRVNRHLIDLAKDFTTALQRVGVAQEPAHRLGHYLSGVFQSLLLMAHARADSALIEDFITIALQPLKDP